MITPRFQELMTEGWGLANKLYFKELDPHEFDQWVENCKSLLSRCEPEPQGFPWCPDHRHIEEIVMLLHNVSSEISKGKIQYTGLL